MIKNISSIVLFLTITIPLLHAQDTSQLKRTPYKLKVIVDKKTFYEEDLNATPYVLPGNTIQLYPGEAIFIEIDQTDGVIKGIKAVKEIKAPAKTLTISFTQSVNKKIHELMMLKVINPFTYRLSYKAMIYLRRCLVFNQQRINAAYSNGKYITFEIGKYNPPQHLHLFK
jgi:hypothetical protein